MPGDLAHKNDAVHQILLMVNSAAVTVLFTLSLLLWRSLYFQTHWAFVVLLPLWLFSFIGIYQNILDKRRSIMLATLRESTRLVSLLTGRALPAAAALAISLLSVSAIAFYALFASSIQLLFLVGLVSVSVMIYLSLLNIFRFHIKQLALSWFSAASTILAASILFVTPMALIEWTMVRPSYIRLDFVQAASAALAELPPRSDLVNQVISAYQLLELTKIWLASRFTGTMIPGALYAVHSALICVLLVTCSVGTASFFRHNIEGCRRQRTQIPKDPGND